MIRRRRWKSNSNLAYHNLPLERHGGGEITATSETAPGIRFPEYRLARSIENNTGNLAASSFVQQLHYPGTIVSFMFVQGCVKQEVTGLAKSRFPDTPEAKTNIAPGQFPARYLPIWCCVPAYAVSSSTNKSSSNSPSDSCNCFASF